MTYVRKVDGEIVNRVRVCRLLSGRYAIETCMYDDPFTVNINMPLFQTEEEAHKWLKSTGKLEVDTSEGGDSHA